MGPYRSASVDLGALVRRHRSPAPVRPALLFLVIFGLPGIALLTGFQSARGELFAGDRTTNALLGGAFLAVAVAACVALVRKASLSVDVHENGLVWNERGLRRRIPWSEIASVRGRHVSRRVEGVEITRSRVYRILLEGGRELVATHLLADVDALAARIERVLEERRQSRQSRTGA